MTMDVRGELNAADTASAGSKLRTTLRSVAVLSMAALAVLLCFGSGPAYAKAVGGITSVKIVSPNADPTQPLTKGQRFRVDATWAVPDSAQPGDTFSLTFPTPVTGFSSSFTLTSPVATLPVGTCTVNPGSIVCTLSSYVTKYDGVHGSLFFDATASETTSSNSVTFVSSNGTKFDVPLPGGGIVGQPSIPPTTITKYGYVAGDAQTVRWGLYLPGNKIITKAGVSFSFSDTYDARLSQVPYVVVGYADASTWSTAYHETLFHHGTGPDTYALVATAHGFTITINKPTTNADRIYFVRYRTGIPAGLAPGTELTNSITYNGVVQKRIQVQTVDYGGSGSGSVPSSTPPSSPTTSSTSPSTSTSSSTSSSATTSSSSSGSFGASGASSSASSSNSFGAAGENESAGTADTGVSAGEQLLVGVGLLSVGSLLVLSGRRRRAHRTH